MKRLEVLFALLILALPLGAGGQKESRPSPNPEAAAGPYKGYPRGEALIAPQELKSLLDRGDGSVVVLAADNLASYTLAHIPGAYLWERSAYEAPADSQGGVNGNLLEAPGFTALAQRYGIHPETTVVVYDTRYDATRLWWAFTYYGHAKVRVLDGGVASWQALGYPTENFSPAQPAQAGTWVARIAYPNLRVRTEAIVTLKPGQNGQLWDTRERAEFTGEQLLRGASRAGRIPGAEFNWWGDFKTASNLSEWKSYTEIRQLLTDLGYDTSKDQYFYCQSGVRSTQALFALYLSGWDLERLHNYDDSWIGYSRASELPLVLGATN